MLKYLAFICPLFLFFIQCNSPTASDAPAKWESINNGLDNLTIQILASDPLNANTLYAGTARGIYKTTDGGSKWVEINNGLTGLDIKTIAVHPQSSIVYCGTWGDGVFESDDGGENWQAVKGFETPLINSIAINPNAPQEIAVGTEENLYKSSDGGQTWTKSFGPGNVQSVVWLNTSSQTMFIGVQYQGIYRSVNDGETWEKRNSGLFKSGSNYVAPKSFAFKDGGQTIFIGTDWVDVYRSEDSGTNWVVHMNGTENARVKDIVVDPLDDNVIWAATDQGILQSTDNGESWPLFAGLGAVGNAQSILAIPSEGKTILYVGTMTKGIFRYVARY